MNLNYRWMLILGIVGAAVLRAQNPISADARQSYALVKDSLLKAADRMPAEDYSFRTVAQVRTFGEMIAHVADAQLLMCQVVKGEKTTANAKFAPPKTAKADLVASLKTSFDYCDPVYASMTDAAEIARGSGDGRPRNKFTDVAEMLAAAASASSAHPLRSRLLARLRDR